ncbi:ATP-binding cassette domain-containing protein [Burkholderiaceae bacterium DAT-1]|nr:ATP-binding cassette domain-containing protein [Burkholderiaceae bacterium DAT-1]
MSFPYITLQAGETAVLCGPSGSGKTTLLSLICGMLRVQTGNIRVHDQSLTSLNSRQLDRFRGRHIGILPQRFHLIASLNATENIALARHLAGLPPDPARIDTLLHALDIHMLTNRRPAALSQGQAQRVALARALINAPGLLLADEPTANLDDAAADAVINLLIQQAHSHQAALLIASHDSRVKARLPRQIDLGAAS